MCFGLAQTARRPTTLTNAWPFGNFTWNGQGPAIIFNPDLTINTVFLQILTLLDIMKLSQYKEGFLEVNIDGAILAECDEPLLEEELQIKNKLHRNRLMKVIIGRYSAQNLTHGLDPYGGTVTSIRRPKQHQNAIQ